MTDIVKTSKLTIVAFFLSLLTIAGVGALYYTQINYNKSLKTQLEAINAKNSSQDVVNQSMQNALSDNVKRIDNRVNSLSGNQNSIIVFELNQLVSLANQGLIVYGDTDGTIRLLNYAKTMLIGNNDAIFTGIKVAITKDVTKLQSSPKVDNVIISSELDTLVPLLSNMSINKELVPIDPSKQTKLQKFWLNIKYSLLGLISIKRVGTVATPKTLSIAVEEIRMNILGAKLAVLQHDEKSYVYNIQIARKELDQSFANYVGFKEIDDKLQQLQNIDIGNSNTNIDLTIKELNKLNNLK